jgi:iron complex outermembrane receptor protein
MKPCGYKALREGALVCVGIATALGWASSGAVAQNPPADLSADPASPPLVPRPTPPLEAPEVVMAPQAEYPAGDTRVRPRVVVTLEVLVDVAGKVADSHVTRVEPPSATAAFEPLARQAMARARFIPARRDGVAVPAQIQYELVFEPSPAPLLAPVPAPMPAPPDQTSGQPPVVSAAPAAAPSKSGVDEVVVRTQRKRPSRGASDFDIEIGELRHSFFPNAAALLRIAPGILLTNEGGDGHADSVYLRGFDAREGQDVEFTIEGVPLNEVGNPHGEGLTNLSFIIPELVDSIRVLEGPFDPHQGNFAVAGSAEYSLALPQRGVTLQYMLGSYGTHRALALWGPEDTGKETFGGVELRTTQGFGQNRDARHARAMGQYKVDLHALSSKAAMKLLLMAHTGQFGSAGVIREDDYQAGRIGFFDTYDAGQGGSLSRVMASASIEDDRERRTLRQQFFAAVRTSRNQMNFTGFLEDPPAPYRSGLEQRGDMTDQAYDATMVGARGSVRLREPWNGQKQEFEVGYYVRHDDADSSQRRLRAGTVVPYRIDFDLEQSVTNIGLYADAQFKPASWFTLRGGVRGDLFTFDVLNKCDYHDDFVNSAVNNQDELCYSRDRTGARDPTARRTASGLIAQPRATMLVGPFDRLRGEWRHLTLTGSVGVGSRAVDPSYIAQEDRTPFASVLATEGGLLYQRTLRRSPLGPLSLQARGIYYYTHVAQDLIFNPQEGRNTLAPGTRRQGMVAATRVTGSWLDWAASATYAHARFEDTDPGVAGAYVPADAGNVVPYVPEWVVRSDAAVYGSPRWLQWFGQQLRGRAGLGFSYISPRPLPFNERGDPFYVLDGNLALRWKHIEAGLNVQNILDQRYRLSEFNYASEFDANTPTPDLIPARHFTAGPPRMIFLMLTWFTDAGASNGGHHAS